MQNALVWTTAQGLVYASQAIRPLPLTPSSRQRWGWSEVPTSFLSSWSSLESAFLQATNSKASAEAFAMFPPSAAHFPGLAVNCSLRSPGCRLSQSRQRFSLARNKKACRTGPRAARHGQGLRCPTVQLRSVFSVQTCL